MKINEAGLNLIKSFESCKLQAYQDIKGIWTIGYGHVGGEARPGAVINQAMADNLLRKDVEHTEQGVSRCVKIPLNENQFSALVCFAFNVGVHALEKSTLLSYLNAGKLKEAAQEFERWDRASGVEVPGLLRRRRAEKALFLS